MSKISNLRPGFRFLSATTAALSLLAFTGCAISVSPNDPGLSWGSSNKIRGEAFSINSSYARIEGPTYDQQAYLVLSNAYAYSCQIARINEGPEKIIISVPARAGVYSSEQNSSFASVSFISRQTLRQESARSFVVTVTSVDAFTINGRVRAVIDDLTTVDMQFSVDATCR